MRLDGRRGTRGDAASDVPQIVICAACFDDRVLYVVRECRELLALGDV